MKTEVAKFLEHNNTTRRVRTDRGHLRAGRQTIAWGVRTLLMGIVNVTPDSFSGDGETNQDAAVQKALCHLRDGADIIDIGGESTRPGYQPVDADLEMQRVLPVVAQLRLQGDAIISIDSTKAQVIKAAVQAGANILNSVCGIDGNLLDIALELGVPIIIMHNKAEAIYKENVVDEVLQYLDRSASTAVAAGMLVEQVILDPGIGFGKLPEHNIALLRNLERLVTLGFPTMLGSSRKSTIGKITGRPIDKRAFGTAATVALAVQAGVDIVRVHDVAEMRDVVRVSDAIVRGWRPEEWGMQP